MASQYLRITKWSLIALIVCTLAISHVSAAAPSLEDLASGVKIDKTEISVSGISSGGFMAHQFHVAHSSHVMGVGVIAGGPYYCAKGSIVGAVTRCSKFVELECGSLLQMFGLDGSDCEKTFLGPKDDKEAQEMAKESFLEAVEKNGQDFKDNMKSDRIYLFSGLQDAVVPGTVMDAVFHFYTDTDKGNVDEKQVRDNDEFPVRHAMIRDHRIERPPTKIVNECNQRPAPPAYDTYIDDCQDTVAPLLAQCNCRDVPGEAGPACEPSDPAKRESCEDLYDVDLAGAILNHLYGELNGREVVDKEKVQAFDQRQIFKKLSPSPFTATQLASMAKEGYVYIPEACKGSNSECRLHVAFHGCLQGAETGELTGDSDNLFSQYAGYNAWAKINNIVVLYPQVRRWNGTVANPPINPQGCWDWWGQAYTHENYHTQDGTQIKAVAQMINVLVGEALLEVPGTK